MKITFIGTRANIKHRSKKHHFNAACLVQYRSTTIMIDCGLDWKSSMKRRCFLPDGILITHAHPDHVGGLKDGAACPVYALKQVHDLIKKDFLYVQKVIVARKAFKIGGITIQAFLVEHAVNTPTVGYRIRAGRHSTFYISDVVFIYQPIVALRGVDFYIGDGSRITHSLVRKHGEHKMGHASILTQLDWCRRARVKHAIFTHCGTQLVNQGLKAEQKVAALAKQRGIQGSVAHDGMIVCV